MAYTDIDKSDDYFTTFLWTGDGSTSPRVHTGVGLQADMMWSKVRSTGHQHNLVDRVRGVNQRLLMPSDSNDEDTTCTHGHFDSLDSDGFTTTNAGGNWNVNASGETYVGWFWKANGSGSSNTDGSITSTVSANTTSGFSIVSFTGTGATATVGHGLGVKPYLIIAKNRTDTVDWYVYHSSLGATKNLRLNQNYAELTESAPWDNTEPTTSVISVNNANGTNGSSDNLIFYCMTSKKGFSKFGSYTGNGSADGTFIYTGFKPAMIIRKVSSTTGGWLIHDSTRTPFNGLNSNTNGLRPSSSEAEFDFFDIDYLSNGFKIRTAEANHNQSGQTFIYIAFASSPFVTSTGIPTCAR